MLKIKVNKLRKADIHELLKFAWCIDKDAVISEFAKHGIAIDGPEDLENLAALHRNGGDVAGRVQRKNGEKIYFNVEKVLADVQVQEEKKAKMFTLNLDWK